MSEVSDDFLGLVFLPGEGRLWWFLEIRRGVVIETENFPNV